MPGLRDVLDVGVERRADWLWHPCAAALTLDGPPDRWEHDLELVLWVVLNCNLEGRVNVPEPIPVWALAEGQEVPAGRHDVQAIVEQPAGDRPSVIALDVWCGALGVPLDGSWALSPPGEEADGSQLESELVRFLRATAFLQDRLPACHDWLARTTRVAVPLRPVEDAFQSVSFPDVPALVGLDLKSEVLILESLVHESAHVNLYLEEVAGPLVDPADQGLFPSPLRADLRPLRGILMAYHALAYISAFYGDALAARPEDAVFESERASACALADDAESTLAAEAHRLTDSGRRFFASTQDVLRHDAV